MAINDMPELVKGARITGRARTTIAEFLAQKYAEGATVRALAEITGRSYGFVHRVLGESGVRFRARSRPTIHKGQGGAMK
jgi:hypothetical protein